MPQITSCMCVCVCMQAVYAAIPVYIHIYICSNDCIHPGACYFSLPLTSYLLLMVHCVHFSPIHAIIPCVVLFATHALYRPCVYIRRSMRVYQAMVFASNCPLCSSIVAVISFAKSRSRQLYTSNRCMLFQSTHYFLLLLMVHCVHVPPMNAIISCVVLFATISHWQYAMIRRPLYQ